MQISKILITSFANVGGLNEIALKWLVAHVNPKFNRKPTAEQ